MLKWSACLALLPLVLANSVSSAQTHIRASHALLIGISDYSASEGVSSLMGPPNDIARVRDLLKSKFRVPETNITTLLNPQATHSAIDTAFAKLADDVRAGDLVYIHYSGHGSTRPNTTETTWVTYGSRNQKFPAPDKRDVVDKEINLWLQPLYKKVRAAEAEKKAPIDLVIVSDSCHSGTFARSIDKDRMTSVREVKPDPARYPDLTSAESSSSLRGVRIGAARDTELAVEFDPRTGGDCKDPEHCAGVFTWYWVEALKQAMPGERWGDVFKRTYTKVTAGSFNAQRPQREGHVDRPIFGGEFEAPSLTVAVTGVDAGKKTVQLAAGGASGVTKGSLYRLYTGSNRSEKDDAELEILNASHGATSEAKLLKGTVQKGDLVTEVRHAYQFNPTRLYVAPDLPNDQPLIQEIQEEIQGKGTGTGLLGFELVSNRAQADLLLYVLHPKKNAKGQYDYGQSTRQRLPPSFPEQPPEVWVVTPQEQVLHDLMRIAFSNKQEGKRVLRKNLRAFVWSRQVRQLEALGSAPKVSVQVSVLRPDATCEPECLYAPDDEKRKAPHKKIASYVLREAPATVKRGDSITFSIRNEDRQRSWYVYLLNIAPDGSVCSIYPTRDDIQEKARLNAEQRVDLDTQEEKVRAWLEFDEPGVETIKLIASTSPIDVRLLENEGGYEKRGGLNPLEALLKAADRRSRNSQGIKIDDWGTLQADFEVGVQ